MIFDLPRFGELAPLIHLKELPLRCSRVFKGRLVLAARFGGMHTDEECRFAGCGSRRDLIRTRAQRPKSRSCESASGSVYTLRR